MARWARYSVTPNEAKYSVMCCSCSYIRSTPASSAITRSSSTTMTMQRSLRMSIAAERLPLKCSRTYASNRSVNFATSSPTNGTTGENPRWPTPGASPSSMSSVGAAPFTWSAKVVNGPHCSRVNHASRLTDEPSISAQRSLILRTLCSTTGVSPHTPTRTPQRPSPDSSARRCSSSSGSAPLPPMYSPSSGNCQARIGKEKSPGTPRIAPLIRSSRMMSTAWASWSLRGTVRFSDTIDSGLGISQTPIFTTMP